MAAIAKNIGKTLDLTMFCNHCNQCEAWKSKREIGAVDDLQFMDTDIKLFPSCMLNHEESAQEMYYKCIKIGFVEKLNI